MVVVEELSDDNDEAATVNQDGSSTANAQAVKAKAKARAETQERTMAAEAKAAAKAAAAKARAEKKAIAKARRTNGAEYGKSMEDANVFINVYDITPRLNRWLRCCFLQWGVYHTGVEVYGKEFAFGGHDAETTGVFCAQPKAIKGAVFQKRIPVGRTELSPSELRQQIAALAPEWSGNSYNLLKRNCNHFTVDLCEDLTGESGPRYINRCAKSCIVRCIWSACLKPLARCLDRCSIWNRGVAYAEDESPDNSGDSDYCIKGARGMNEVLVEAATAQKEKANCFFRSGEYDQAARIYMQALSLVQSLSRLDDELDSDLLVMQQAKEVCKALLLNIAACNLKAQDWERTILCCDQVLEWDAESSKAFFRKGMALSKIGKLEEALENLQKALLLTSQTDAATLQHIEQEIDAVQSERGMASS